MSWEKPNAADFWKAVETYLDVAYGGTPPPAVLTRIFGLRSLPQDALYRSPTFEPAPKDEPAKLSLRLGNQWYPHMKLVIERAPDGRTTLFRADTHDRHIKVDPSSRDYAAFCELSEKNQSLAGRIEAAWEAQALTTFKSYLREDLARRKRQLP
jgi:hypothetical protein